MECSLPDSLIRMVFISHTRTDRAMVRFLHQDPKKVRTDLLHSMTGQFYVHMNNAVSLLPT